MDLENRFFLRGMLSTKVNTSIITSREKGNYKLIIIFIRDPSYRIQPVETAIRELANMNTLASSKTGRRMALEY